MWQRFNRFVKARILHISDSPHKIALGVAIGIFVGWTPVIGPHMIMALALCAVLRANKLVGVACVWVSNPFTFPFIYPPSYLVGRAIVGLWKGPQAPDHVHLKQVFHELDLIGSIFTNFHRAEFWRQLFDIVIKFGVELWIGCLIVGSIAAIGGYFFTYWLIFSYRRHHPRRRFAEFQ
jgi:uncharacterized protein (DUF2062 family)